MSEWTREWTPVACANSEQTLDLGEVVVTESPRRLFRPGADSQLAGSLRPILGTGVSLKLEYRGLKEIKPGAYRARVVLEPVE